MTYSSNSSKITRLIRMVERKYPECRCYVHLKDYDYWWGYEVRKRVGDEIQIIKVSKFFNQPRGNKNG